MLCGDLKRDYLGWRMKTVRIALASAATALLLLVPSVAGAASTHLSLTVHPAASKHIHYRTISGYLYHGDERVSGGPVTVLIFRGADHLVWHKVFPVVTADWGFNFRTAVLPTGEYKAVAHGEGKTATVHFHQD